MSGAVKGFAPAPGSKLMLVAAAAAGGHGLLVSSADAQQSFE